MNVVKPIYVSANNDMRAPGERDGDGFAGPATTPAPSLRGDPLGRRLAPREVVVLSVYAQTGDYREVAVAMGISRTTVGHLLGLAYRKLGVSSAIDAFRALGWLRVP